MGDNRRMAKDKKGKCRAHVRRCLVTLEPITKEKIMKSGSTISEYTRALVLGRTRPRPISSPIKHAIYPHKTLLPKGEVETVETLRHQVKNQLEIINQQDIQLLHRDVAIYLLRTENKKLREKVCRQMVLRGRVSKSLKDKLAVHSPKKPPPRKTISNSSLRAKSPGKDSPSVQVPVKPSPSLPMKTITLVLPSDMRVKAQKTIRTSNLDKSTSPLKDGSLESLVDGASMKKSTRNEGSQTMTFPKTTISIISPSPVSSPKPVKLPVSPKPKRVLTPEPKEILYSDKRRCAKWPQRPSPRTRKIHRSYKAQLNGNLDSEDGSDADYEVESEESEESDELPDDIDAEPCLGLRTSSRKPSVDPVPVVSVPSPKPVITNRPRIQRRKFPKDTLSRKKSTFEKLLEENTLSRPTLAERLPKSLRPKLESELSGNPQFRALVNLKRAQIDHSKQRLMTSKVLCPLLSKNRQIGLGNGKTAIGVEKIRDRKRGRPLGSFKKVSSGEEPEPKSSALPNGEVSSKTLPKEEKGRETQSWISQMIVGKDRKVSSTLEPYYIASLPTEATSEGYMSIPNSEPIEVPSWRVRTYPPSYRSTGLESVDDLTYLKRHGKGEEDEKRRKRWDAQKLREETYVEYLRIRLARRSTTKGKGRRDGTAGSSKSSCESFHPDPMGALTIEIQDEIPINIFGCGLPVLEFKDFELPTSFFEARMPELQVEAKTSIDPIATPSKVPGRATAVPFLGKKRRISNL